MDKQRYRAAPGVAWVNGAAVPKSGIVELTTAQARFDLEQGRITLDAGKPAKRGRQVASAEGDFPPEATTNG